MDIQSLVQKYYLFDILHKNIELTPTHFSLLEAHGDPALDTLFCSRFPNTTLDSQYPRLLSLVSKKTALNTKVFHTFTDASQKILPSSSKRNILITSALPYVNNIPHLGNIIGCVLSADVYARYARIRGYTTLYICGTDEYGTATETKALSQGISCQQLCDTYHALHKSCYDWFGISFDHFGRTTTPKQTEIAQDIFWKCLEMGHVKEESVTQLFCETHKRFLADRYVTGTCPLCGYNDARGDQCDGCGKLLNAIELIDPKCTLDGTKPIEKASDHLFLDLAKLQNGLEKWFDQSAVQGKWSPNGITITSAWLKEGLKQRCITRDLKWGTPVPKEGYEDKVFYVWFDAPIGYISITANYTLEWEQWWKQPKNVELYQFMGKDNVPFHSVIFPCSLMATHQDWTLVNHISTTEYLQYENQKFSKSRGVGVFGNNVMDSNIPVEVWRYYLLSIRPETSDAQFTWSGLISANNNECLSNLGNFCNRVMKFLDAKYARVVPCSTYTCLTQPTLQLLKTHLLTYLSSLEHTKLRQGLKSVMEMSSLMNKYLQDNTLSTKLFTGERERCDEVIRFSVNVMYLLASLLYPYMPTTSHTLLKCLNISQYRTLEGVEMWNGEDVFGGHVVGQVEYLFVKIEESFGEVLREKYGGSCASEPLKENVNGEKEKGTSKQEEAGLEDKKSVDQEALKNDIKILGDKVRELKKEGDKEKIGEAVKALLALKAKLV